MSSIPLLTGQDGARLPAIGLGTYDLRGAAGVAATASAIDAGYRLLDTAFNYDNEGAVGRAVAESSVPRESLIYSTKLPGRYHRHDLARHAIEESLFRSGLDRLDLVLIHWPNPRLGLYAEAWKALVEAREDGLVSMIGVSNFLPEHLDRIIGDTGVTPVLNQILVHPYAPQDAWRAANAERGVLTEGYSPLGKDTDLVREPAVTRIAAAHEVSAAQLLLAWSVSLGVIPLPKSATPARQAENLDVFDIELTDDELGELAGLARPGEGADPMTHEEL
ncbi:aldo/keto reductase [uncultured Amnibacterium sp.]|uniref:aldo/keto reductase n=1 Tax=uncultured Amnibacterium sp. TaxID=1631851 RepID=UPI0035CA9B85